MKKYLQIAAMATGLVFVGGMESAGAFTTQWNAFQFSAGDATSGDVALLSDLTTFGDLYGALTNYFSSHSISSFLSEADAFTTSLGFGPPAPLNAGSVTVDTVSVVEDYNLTFSGTNVLVNGGTGVVGGSTITAVPGPVAGAGIPALVALIGFAGYAAYRRQKLA